MRPSHGSQKQGANIPTALRFCSILLDSASLFADAARLAYNEGGEFSTDVRTASGFFGNAADRDPWNSDPHSKWGGLLLDTGDAAGALDQLERALRINKWDWIAWTVRARALHSLGRTKRARAALARAQAIRPLRSRRSQDGRSSELNVTAPALGSPTGAWPSFFVPRFTVGRCGSGDA